MGTDYNSYFITILNRTKEREKEKEKRKKREIKEN